MESLRKYIPRKKDGFATAINCIDGRGQKPVTQAIKKDTGAQFVDTVTGPGIVGGLANGDQEVIDSAKAQLTISVEKHNSKGIIVGGHASCAGHPVEDNTHKKDVVAAVAEVRSWDIVRANDLSVTGVFVEPRKTLFRRRPNSRRWVARKV